MPPVVLDGKYELLEMAGEGGMASVWKAQVKGAAGFSRTVAIKKIKSEFRSIKNYTEMFIEEARVGAELAHPNIVQVYDFCVDPQGTYYIVMEWVEGMDLGSFVKAERDAHGKTPWPVIVSAGIGTLRGLGAAHERKRPDGTPAPIVHRDVSPHNILLGTNGAVKLTDFGLARARDRMVSLTAPGTVKGKLSYLSPEVAMGGQATPASDLFAMGAVLWEALTGERLFDGRSDLDVFKLIRQCVIRPLASFRPDLPPDLVTVIERALAKKPDDRFGSAASFAFMLGEVLREAPPGDDHQATLGAAVTDARARLGVKRNPSPLASENIPTWRYAQPTKAAAIAAAGTAAVQTSPTPPAQPAATPPRTPTRPPAIPSAAEKPATGPLRPVAHTVARKTPLPAMPAAGPLAPPTAAPAAPSAGSTIEIDLSESDTTRSAVDSADAIPLTKKKEP